MKIILSLSQQTNKMLLYKTKNHHKKKLKNRFETFEKDPNIKYI